VVGLHLSLGRAADPDPFLHEVAAGQGNQTNNSQHTQALVNNGNNKKVMQKKKQLALTPVLSVISV
jgi:hypothetical protein